MRSRLLLPALLLPLVAAAGPAPEPRTFIGHYTVDWEVQSFRACGRGETWWVSNPGPLMRAFRDALPGEEYGTVYATVRADVTEPGGFGHLGGYRRAMAVREVVEVRPAGDGDCDIREAE